MIKSIILPFLLVSVQAFTPTILTQTRTALLASSNDESNSPVDAFLNDIKMRIRIGQESNAAGFGGKQVLADVFAGEYDEIVMTSMIDEEINSAPCVMFTWDSSPSCKKAIEAFETIGANVKIVRLDDPWSEGNPMRASLGRKVGRTSVPFVYINSKYVGGFDGGSGDEAPGLVELAFNGKLREMIKDAGAMK